MISKHIKPNIRLVIKGLMMKHVYGMITCKEFENFIADYFDGELSESQFRKFNLHVKVCRECSDYLDAYKRTMELARTSLESTEMPEVPESMIKAILAAKDS